VISSAIAAAIAFALIRVPMCRRNERLRFEIFLIRTVPYLEPYPRLP
jgi:hypothetical protein